VTCTATGYPRPRLRLFLIPYRNVTYNQDFYNEKKFPDAYKDFELTNSSGQINVTSAAYPEVEKTIAFYWDDLVARYMSRSGYYLKCHASNTYQSEITSYDVYTGEY
jgi:hypothetical protein